MADSKRISPISRDICFGYGLSYTRFEYGPLAIEHERVDINDGTVTLSLTLQNSGEGEGCEVVQLYVRDLYASMVRPVKGVEGVQTSQATATKQKARVRFAIPVDMLNFTNKDNQRMVEAGEFEIMIGASSSDIRLRGRVEVTGKNRLLDRRWRMESQAHVELLR